MVHALSITIGRKMSQKRRKGKSITEVTERKRRYGSDRFTDLMKKRKDSVKGSVLLDFVYGTVQWSQSGYRIDDLVLTVASPNSGGFFQESSNRAKSYLKITCYQTDGPLLKVVENGRIRNIWMSKNINNIIRGMSQSNLRPYIGNTKCSDDKAIFLLIELNHRYDGLNIINTALSKVSNYSKSLNLVQGQNVYTVYTPFGANEFISSCSKGCLSNKFKDHLFLIDGRLATGCEGAPVFTKAKEKDQEYPFGLVLFPIAVGKDHSSYSLVVPIHIVITTLLDSESFRKPPIEPSLLTSVLKENNPLKGAVSNTVVIQTPVGWGSGIILAPGLVITNSHVIEFGAKSCYPFYVCWKNRTVVAEVVFCSTASSVLDIALLRYNKEFGPTGITFSSKPMEKGENVVAIGYPLHNLTMPSISRGIILNCFEGSVGFTTSCIINAGSSGGPIVLEDGTLVGIVVGILNAGSYPYPELNICLSSTLFKDPLFSYLSSGDTCGWKALVSYDDPWLKSLLSLQKCKY